MDNRRQSCNHAGPRRRPDSNKLRPATIWNGSCTLHRMLRITATTTDKIVLKLEGRLVGPWVDELRTTVFRINGRCAPLEIDVSGLTFADEDGEKALSWLHKMGTRFQGNDSSLKYLFERLTIPLHPQQTKLGGKGGPMEG